MNPDPRSARLGLCYGLGAYGLWGLIPLYFKTVAHVEPFDTLAHRVLWSFAVLALCVLGFRRGAELRRIVHSPRIWGPLLLSTGLIATNWYAFIHAVATRQLTEASLGYFMTPLANVLLGVVVLGERPRRGQWIALGIAALAVGYLAVQSGRPPWIALALAISFSCYGLVRKLVAVEALLGLLVETALMLPLAIGYLIWHAPPLARLATGESADTTTLIWLALGGPVTTVPLLFFAGAARRLTMTALGFLQYLAPSVQFVLAVFVFREPLDPARWICFLGIWTAIVVYLADAWRARR